MATLIKCRYGVSVCRLDVKRRYEDGDKCYCKKRTTLRYVRKYPNVANPSCDFAGVDWREFEKTVKSYEWGEGWLRLRGKEIYAGDISYLEIDGRILIDEGDEKRDD